MSILVLLFVFDIIKVVGVDDMFFYEELVMVIFLLDKMILIM